MSDSIEQLRAELAELENSGSGTPATRSKIAVLKKKISKLEKKGSPEKKENAFAKQSTTTATAARIRLLNTERSYMANRMDSIKINHQDLVLDLFGDMRHINETKVIRAAIMLLENATDEELVHTIKRVVKDEMLGQANNRKKG